MGDYDQKENNAGKNSASKMKGFVVVVTILKKLFIFNLSFEIMKLL